MLRKVLAIYVSSFLIAMPVMANDAVLESVVTTVKKGDTVPFDGTLFSPGAAAELIVKLENNDEKCRIEIKRELDLQNAKFDLDRNKKLNNSEFAFYLRSQLRLAKMSEKDV